MTCSFCGSRNNEGEHRCRKCGRRPGDTLNGEFSLVRTEGALAAKLELRERTASLSLSPTTGPIAAPATGQTVAAEPARQRPAVRGVQQSLFPDRQSNVIQFSEYAPQNPTPQKPALKAPAKPRPANRRRGASERQGSLDFMPPQPAAPRTLSTTVEAVVSCDLPVATAPHRAVAATLDWSISLIAYGLFLAVFFALGGEFTWNRLNLMVFGAVLLLMGFAYGLTWALLGVDSAGMRWMGLRLTTFEGFPLERKQRVMRFAGSCLSFCTVLGQFWSLWDEECLTWQDHISETFPTPRGAQAQVFRRA